jgi:hypothetical protein
MNFIGAEDGTDLEGQLDLFKKLDSALMNQAGGRDELTPFHVVGLHYAKTVGQFLHTSGADINKSDRLGRTPLDLLLKHGSPNKEYNFIGGTQEESQSRFICDYALGGPVYWAREVKHFKLMVRNFRSWGAKTAVQLAQMEETAGEGVHNTGANTNPTDSTMHNDAHTRGRMVSHIRHTDIRAAY